MQQRLTYLIADVTGARVSGGDPVIAGLTADSRAVKPGYLFAALAGSTTDGARFIADAVAAGAVAVLTGPDGDVSGLQDGVAAVRADNPRRALALMAARHFAAQPDIAVAVTGTNGKTSVVSFVRQIWEQMGLAAASMGTVGVSCPGLDLKLEHTTPDPVTIQATLAELARNGVTHVALEASSHGLAQCRLDGIRLAAGAFTNLSRDHLDYHRDVEDYFAAKARLFGELLGEGAGAVVATGSAEAERMLAIARDRHLVTGSVGPGGTWLDLVEQRRDGFGQHLIIAGREARHRIYLPLVGGFQASNALVAAGLVMAAGAQEATAVRALESLRGARGRLELVAPSAAGAPVFVDYAHTPDALRTALEALRPYAEGRLIVVFGCGGDRDRGKRPQMGAIAASHADIAIVTDDNPRGEDPAAIRSQIMAGANGALEIGDRAEAIRKGIALLETGDVLLVAGKGHEEGQTVGDRVIPFSDHDVVKAAVRETADA